MRLEIPRSIQTNGKFTEATKRIDNKINISKRIFLILEIGKNSITKRNIRQANPAKSPKAFQEPRTLPVLPAKIPRERKLGINRCAVWKTKTIAEDNITPSRTTFAFSLVLKTMEDISIRIKPEKINQKLPTSNIVPNRDTCGLGEKTDERRKAKTIPSPEAKSQDLGKIISPSENLAIAQKITQKTSPATNNKPFPVSTGILVKGKQKTGKSTTTKNNDKNESLSNMFERISYIILYTNNKTQHSPYKTIFTSLFFT